VAVARSKLLPGPEACQIKRLENPVIVRLDKPGELRRCSVAQDLPARRNCSRCVADGCRPSGPPRVVLLKQHPRINRERFSLGWRSPAGVGWWPGSRNRSSAPKSTGYHCCSSPERQRPRICGELSVPRSSLYHPIHQPAGRLMRSTEFRLLQLA